MISLFTRDNKLSIERFEQGQLPKLLEWYNMSEEYTYATGIHLPVTLDELDKKFFGALHNEEEVLFGIHLILENTLIGMLKCRITGNILWINILIIDKDYQNMGYGTAVISLLLNHLKKSNGVKEAFLSVAAGNGKGRAFWLKNGFKEMQQEENKITFNGKEQVVIIMKRVI